MKRFDSYFSDVMAGRRGNPLIGFGLMLLAISTGGAIAILMIGAAALVGMHFWASF
jgi:hypothetical protein